MIEVTKEEYDRIMKMILLSDRVEKQYDAYIKRLKAERDANFEFMQKIKMGASGFDVASRVLSCDA